MKRNALNLPIAAGLLLYAATSIVRGLIMMPTPLMIALYIGALALEVWGIVQIGLARLGQ